MRKMIAKIAMAAAFGLAGGAALAQESGEAAAPAQPPKWLVNCTNTGAEGELQCKMSQSVVIVRTGQRLLNVNITKPAGEEQAAMMVSLPYGFFLPAGVKLAVDGEETETLPVQTCDGNGCYAGLALSADILEKFRAGGEISFTLQDLQKQEINIKGTLEGFGSAYDRLL